MDIINIRGYIIKYENKYKYKFIFKKIYYIIYLRVFKIKILYKIYTYS